MLSIHQEPHPPSLLRLLPSPIWGSSLNQPSSLRLLFQHLSPSSAVESSLPHAGWKCPPPATPRPLPITNPSPSQPVVIAVNSLDRKPASLAPQKINKSDSDAYCSGHSQNQLKDFKSLSTEQLAGYTRPRYVSGKADQGWKSEGMKERANNQELPGALGHTVSFRRQVPNCMVILTRGGGGRKSGWLGREGARRGS